MEYFHPAYVWKHFQNEEIFSWLLQLTILQMSNITSFKKEKSFSSF